MWWSRRTFLALPILLAACGFTPVYGPGGSGAALLGTVQVQELRTRDGFLLVQRLEERLGRPTLPAYTLSLDLSTQQAGLAVDPEGDIERFDVIGSVAFRLERIDDGAIVASGYVEDFTGYSASGSTVATLSAEKDARARLMIILADEIVVRLQSSDLGG